MTVFNKKTAAKILCVSVETVDRYRRNRRLSYHQIGDRIIFTEDDLLGFLENCAIPATALPTSREQQEIRKAAGGVK
jgi:hypothetical protein